MAQTDLINEGLLADYHDELITDVINPIQAGKADKVTVVQQSASSASISPNVLNVWGEIGSLAITLAAGSAGVVNEYMFQFTSPSGAGTALTLPNTVRWANDDELEPEAGFTYQVSIVDNLAVYAGWEAQGNA